MGSRIDLRGVWERVGGEAEGGSPQDLYAVVLLRPCLWGVTRRRQRGHGQLEKSFTISYDRTDGVHYWGIKKAYFFDPVRDVTADQRVHWHEAGSTRARPAFTWLRRPGEAPRSSISSWGAGEPEWGATGQGWRSPSTWSWEHPGRDEKQVAPESDGVEWQGGWKGPSPSRGRQSAWWDWQQPAPEAHGGGRWAGAEWQQPAAQPEEHKHRVPRRPPHSGEWGRSPGGARAQSALEDPEPEPSTGPEHRTGSQCGLVLPAAAAPDRRLEPFLADKLWTSGRFGLLEVSGGGSPDCLHVQVTAAWGLRLRGTSLTLELPGLCLRLVGKASDPGSHAVWHSVPAEVGAPSFKDAWSRVGVVETPIPVGATREEQILRPFIVGSTWRSQVFGDLAVSGEPAAGALAVQLVEPWELRAWGGSVALETPGGLRWQLATSRSGAEECRAVWTRLGAAAGAVDPLEDRWCRGGPGAKVATGGGAAGHGSPSGGAARGGLGAAEEVARAALEGGQAALDGGNAAEAIRLFSEAVRGATEASQQGFQWQHQLEGVSLLAYALRARSEAALVCGRHDDAHVDAEAACRLAPSCLKTRHALALTSIATSHLEGAVEAYREALRLQPEPPLADLLCDELRQAMQFLLGSRLVDSCRFTLEAFSFSAKDVWNLADGCQERQFALLHQASSWRPGLQIPYLLTLPRDVCAREPTGEQKSYPLIVYLHGGASADICKGDVMRRQLEFIVESSPFGRLVERHGGLPGLLGSFISLAPCCPPNVQALGGQQCKADGRRKVYWFKTCETSAYNGWTFSGARRCREVELLVTELLDDICRDLPVDLGRIYLVGASAGGYGVLRLAELLPGLAAAVVPMCGYYPSIPEHDHDLRVLAERLRGGPAVLPMHCKQDKVCQPHMPCISDTYRMLEQCCGAQVRWVSSVGPDYHKLDHEIARRRLREQLPAAPPA
ncbi:unnamed protein product [Prorocentrum cordatum]|uniref:Feruloyl esterase n=1 Tax=Prorocentrum cordatum TaxID=2364126 RepID=A0ABN9US26_9DINO|nr:unnamed protein product [Polarella glacialis]